MRKNTPAQHRSPNARRTSHHRLHNTIRQEFQHLQHNLQDIITQAEEALRTSNSELHTQISISQRAQTGTAGHDTSPFLSDVSLYCRDIRKTLEQQQHLPVPKIIFAAADIWIYTNDQTFPLGLKPLNAALYALIATFAPIRLCRHTIPQYWNDLLRCYRYFSRGNRHYQYFVEHFHNLPPQERWQKFEAKVYKLISEINAHIRRLSCSDALKKQLFVSTEGSYGQKRYRITIPPDFRPKALTLRVLA